MLYVAIFAFIFGIAIRSFIPIDPFYVYSLALLCTGCAIFFHRVRVWRYLGCAAIFLFFGALRFSAAAPESGSRHISAYAGREIAIEGVIARDPDFGERSMRYTLRRVRVFVDGGAREVDGRVLWTHALYPRFSFGDRVRIACELIDPGSRGAAYRGYLAGKGIYTLCSYPKSVELVSSHEGGALERWLYDVKNGLRVQTYKVFPSPHAGLLLGLLIGDTSGIPRYLNDAFIKTGTIHIVAISGYNISIILVLLLTIAPYVYLSRRVAWVAVIPILLGFVFITGAESSVVRAAIMALIASLASEAGRLGDVRRVLAITAFLMVLQNPYLLVFDVGFELSFAATLGLVYLSPRIARWLSARYPFRLITDIIATTVGANLAVAPILLVRFGRVSLISPLVNIAIVWVIPFAMALGFAAVSLSYLFFPLGEAVGWFAWAILEYVIRVVRFFA